MYILIHGFKIPISEKLWEKKSQQLNDIRLQLNDLVVTDNVFQKIQSDFWLQIAHKQMIFLSRVYLKISNRLITEMYFSHLRTIQRCYRWMIGCMIIKTSVQNFNPILSSFLERPPTALLEWCKDWRQRSEIQWVYYPRPNTSAASERAAAWSRWPQKTVRK